MNDERRMAEMIELCVAQEKGSAAVGDDWTDQEMQTLYESVLTRRGCPHFMVFRRGDLAGLTPSAAPEAGETP